MRARQLSLTYSRFRQRKKLSAMLCWDYQELWTRVRSRLLQHNQKASRTFFGTIVKHDIRPRDVLRVCAGDRHDACNKVSNVIFVMAFNGQLKSDNFGPTKYHIYFEHHCGITKMQKLRKWCTAPITFHKIINWKSTLVKEVKFLRMQGQLGNNLGSDNFGWCLLHPYDNSKARFRDTKSLATGLQNLPIEACFAEFHWTAYSSFHILVHLSNIHSHISHVLKSLI